MSIPITHVTEEMHDLIYELCEKEKVSLSAFVRTALEELLLQIPAELKATIKVYMERPEKPAKTGRVVRFIKRIPHVNTTELMSKQLRALSYLEGVSSSYIVRKAIDRYITRKEGE